MHGHLNVKLLIILCNVCLILLQNDYNTVPTPRRDETLINLNPFNLCISYVLYKYWCTTPEDDPKEMGQNMSKVLCFNHKSFILCYSAYWYIHEFEQTVHGCEYHKNNSHMFTQEHVRPAILSAAHYNTHS